MPRPFVVLRSLRVAEHRYLFQVRHVCQALCEGGWARYVAKGTSEATTISVVSDLHSHSISLTQQRAHVDFQVVVFILGDSKYKMQSSPFIRPSV